MHALEIRLPPAPHSRCLAGTSALALVATAQAQQAEQGIRFPAAIRPSSKRLGGQRQWRVITAKAMSASAAPRAPKSTPPVPRDSAIDSTVTEQQLKDRNPQRCWRRSPIRRAHRGRLWFRSSLRRILRAAGFDVTFTGIFPRQSPPAGGCRLGLQERTLRARRRFDPARPPRPSTGATGAGGLYNLITKRRRRPAERGAGPIRQSRTAIRASSTYRAR